MPPFLSSLVAALLSRQSDDQPSDEIDDLSLDLATFRSDETRLISPDGAHHPPPAGSMAVAYSLFLLARCAPNHERLSPPSTRRLPVHIDLRGEHGVHAQRDPTEARMPPSDPTAVSDVVLRDVAERQKLHNHLAHASDLRAGHRHIAIVTTAAMPWMTGTSVNPALRAVYLAKHGHDVILVVPWLSTIEEQRKVFSKGSPVFKAKSEQANYIVEWARSHVADVIIDVRFYEGVYSDDLCSILPVGAITDVFADDTLVKDVCILEEPEHLTWHHSGQVWTELFNLVVGIIHTNYIEYAKNFGFFGPQKALALLFLNVWVCRGYCHRVIKLSNAVQEFPNSITSNVHGVRDNFLQTGRSREGSFPRGAYFMGKVLWAKGYRDLIDHMIDHYHVRGRQLPIDFFGSGPDVADVESTLRAEEALGKVSFHAGVVDHGGKWLQGYKVFVNASRSDVVCTATAEALAMGKFVVCLNHASNDFFATFPNCMTYDTGEQFSVAIDRALTIEPQPLSPQDAHRLSWDAATERLYDAVRLPLSKRRASTVDLALGSAHATLSKIYPQPGKNIRRAKQEDEGY